MENSKQLVVSDKCPIKKVENDSYRTCFHQSIGFHCAGYNFPLRSSISIKTHNELNFQLRISPHSAIHIIIIESIVFQSSTSTSTSGQSFIQQIYSFPPEQKCNDQEKHHKAAIVAAQANDWSQLGWMPSFSTSLHHEGRILLVFLAAAAPAPIFRFYFSFFASSSGVIRCVHTFDRGGFFLLSFMAILPINFQFLTPNDAPEATT